MSLGDLILYVILPLMMLAIFFALARLAKGPRIADRVVSLDLLASLGIGVIAVYAIATNQPVILDVVIVLALISFLGTVAFAYYLQRRG